jgi:hypothetical protein
LCFGISIRFVYILRSSDVCSVWQKRRFVVTKEYIAFAHVGEERILDKIPLIEIEGAEETSRYKGTQIDAQFSNVVILSTEAAGYNGGRTYHIQADSKEDCAQLAAQLSSLAKSAARNAVVASAHLGNLRHSSRRLFEAPYFQGFFALLTLAVSAEPCWVHPLTV